MTKTPKSWHVYIVRCADKSLYTGVTTDVSRRVAEHNSGQGAKYTRSRTPVELVWSHPYKNRSEAQISECAIKKKSRKQKERLIETLSGKPLTEVFDILAQASSFTREEIEQFWNEGYYDPGEILM